MGKLSGWLGNFVALKYLPRFFRLIYEASPPLFVSNVLLRLAKSVFPVVLLWVGKEIVDQIVLHTTTDGLSYLRLYRLIALEFGLVVANDLLGRAIGLTETLLGDLYSNASSVGLIQKTARVEISDLEDSDFYDKLERARRQTVGRVSLMSNILAQGQDLITIASLTTALIYYYPVLVLLVAASIIPSFVNELYFSQSSYRLQKRMTPERRELDYMRLLGASDTTAKEVKLFGLADYISGTFSRLAHKYYLETKKLAIRRTTFGAVFHILSDLAYYGAYTLIALKTAAGAISIGDLTFLAGSFGRLRANLSAMFSRFTQINENALYLQDYFDFMDLELEDEPGFERLPLPGTIERGFEFRKVSFAYPESEGMVFDGISLHLAKGEKLALVGENGSGKTTLVKLLLRFYEPTSGAILLDGVDVRHYDKSEYQRLFGAIFQDFVRYYLPAKVNIAVGNIGELDNMPRIEEAARQSLADEVIAGLGKGYSQVLGKRYRKGTELSGGQWQKIAIARAYMSDAPVIILDEPTSALDARSEYEVFQRFIGLAEGKTSIIISHRFSTVRMADRIVVLSGGKVIENGTHGELIENGQLYAELFRLQAEGYRED